MSDPGSMSLTATLVLAVVMIVLSVAWLAAVFLAGRQPAAPGRRGGDPGPGGEL